MTFPVVESRTSSQVDGGNTTSHTVDLPSGIIDGDLLIVFFGCDGATSISWPGDWVEIDEESSFTPSSAVAYRAADGTEGSTITVTTGASERSGATAYRISGAEDPSIQAPEADWRTGNSDTPAFPLLTPTGGSKDYLWLACTAIDRNKTIDASPANYTNLQSQIGGGANSVSVGSTERALAASSERPGTYTISTSDEWTNFTVVIHPAGATNINCDGAFTQAAQTISATGSQSAIGCAGAITQDVQTVVATSSQVLGSNGIVTQDNQTIAATGTVADPAVTGNGAFTQDEQTISATSSQVLGINGAYTQADQGISATSSQVLGSNGSFIQDSQTIAATESQVLGSNAAITQDAQIVEATRSVQDIPISCNGAWVESDNTIAAMGSVIVKSNGICIQDAQTIIATESQVLGSDGVITQDSQTIIATSSIGEIPEEQASDLVIDLTSLLTKSISTTLSEDRL